MGRPKDSGVPEEKIAEALVASKGFTAAAAQALGMSMRQVQRRIFESAALQEVQTEQKEITLDIVEASLLTAVGKGNIVAMIFYLKTQGKHRGYVERQEFKEIDEASDRELMNEARALLKVAGEDEGED